MDEGLCPICLRRPRAVWDHDHRTGVIRGRLCAQCNAALGGFDDDAASLSRAIEYLAQELGTGLWTEHKRKYQRIKMREWRQRNPEREKANRDRWLANPENREKLRAASRRWKAKVNYQPRATELHRIWRAEHPEKVEQYNAQRRKKRVDA